MEKKIRCPNFARKICAESLRLWVIKGSFFKYNTSMMWALNHHDHRFFYVTNVTGSNQKNSSRGVYSFLLSATILVQNS